MAPPVLLRTRTGVPTPLSSLPALEAGEFREAVLGSVAEGRRLAAFFGHPAGNGRLLLVAVLADGAAGAVEIGTTEVDRDYPALTPDCPQAHLFERELAENWGIRPVGHPWLKPVRTHPPTTATDFFRVEGEGVHEVAVGPVHAGVIEPGHFRFQCSGETVHHLEIVLGYQHRGVEAALVGGPRTRTRSMVEAIAGDTTIGHTTAYAEILETLSGTRVPARALALRGVALELERLANHAGDLGALAGDVGYLPTASFCGRIRGDFLNMTAVLAGNRFGRGLLRPGGVGFEAEAERRDDILERLGMAERDLTVAVELLWDTPSVRARFEETGVLSREDCLALGMVGPAARATGLVRDARREFPSGIWRVTQIPVATAPSGDVMARALVRWLEAQRSITFVREGLGALPEGPLRAPVGPLAGHTLAVAVTEGWRGEIWHVALTDVAGRFARYKVVDPSFHNWMGLALAMRGEAISDFPLCNKSFSLSYCGFDL